MKSNSASRPGPYAILIRQMETVSKLDEGDRQVLRSLPLHVRSIDENRDIFREGQASTECCVILSGVACRYKMLSGGRRQIVSFHFAGDMPDLQSLLLNRVDHSLGVLTAATVGFVPHAAISEAGIQRPALAAAFHRQSLIDGSIYREWLANIGRRPGVERVGHLICELYARLRAVELTTSNSFSLPLTQSELGDATGLSTVHVNRSMQELRRKGLVVSAGKRHTICDWKRLSEVADFNPAYLHLLDRPDAA